MKIKQRIDFFSIFWILQFIVLFTLTGFGIETKLLSVVLLGLSIANILTNNKTFKFIYSVILFTYSLIYILIVTSIYIFSNSNILNIIAPTAIGILNFILVFTLWKKIKRIQ